jgi:HAMP domain-containing protein
VAVLARSTAELDERLRVLWAVLAAIAAAGLVTGAIAAVWVARWAGRPLSALDAAAQRLGAGALDTRSAARQGPPEVRRLASTFNTMAGRLEALVHGNRAMMADVSHQLRTPLAALRLRLDLLATDADEATAAELAGAQGEIARLSRLVDGLLAVSRAESAVTVPVPVPVAEVVRDRVAAWSPVAEERAAGLSASGPGQLHASLGEGHLEQILDNLIANALDAVPAGGHVRVSAQPGGRGAQVVVADDGPGMSRAQQEAAFRRFAGNTSGGTGSSPPTAAPPNCRTPRAAASRSPSTCPPRPLRLPHRPTRPTWRPMGRPEGPRFLTSSEPLLNNFPASHAAAWKPCGASRSTTARRPGCCSPWSPLILPARGRPSPARAGEGPVPFARQRPGPVHRSRRLERHLPPITVP